VVQAADDLANHPLQFRKVAKQPDGIELRAFDGHPNAVIMSVHVFTLTAIAAERVPGRKCLFHADLKHFLADRPARWGIRLTRRLHEALNFSDVPAEAVFRQRFDKNFTIMHALDTVIENGQHAAVSSRAYQPAEALL